MRKFLVAFAAFSVAACSSGDGFTDDTGGTNECSLAGQKQFVLDAMNAWYLWNDRLPGNVNPGDYPTPEALLAFLTTFSPDDGSGQPIDDFSFIGSAEADQQFFGEGKYWGFGFSWRSVAAGDIRFTRVFADSPAGTAVPALGRGQRIIALDGRTIDVIEAAEGVAAVLNNESVEFTIRRLDGTEFSVPITKDVVTIDPVPQAFRIQRAGLPDIGYLELATFVSTADAELDAVFADFSDNNVTDVIIDLRYNGGGLVSTAELLGDLFGGAVAPGLPFSKTLFNADRAAENNREKLFALLANSINLSRLVVIATRGTASASEMVTNGMAPHVAVTIVGDNTFGKPVGQVGFEFCEKILRPTAFQNVNADDFGDYFDGLPVTAGCEAADDLDVAVGADADPNMIAALSYIDTGACQAGAAPAVLAKPGVPPELQRPELHGPPWREFAGAY